MKEFTDLVFEPHRTGYGFQAIHNFDNGYVVSVICGKFFYCDENTYELAVLKDGGLTYEPEFVYGMVTF